MTNRLNFFLTGLMLLSLFFTGCTSPISPQNLSNPNGIHSPSPPGEMSFTTTETPISENSTVYHQFSDNITSYELSLGDVTIQQNETTGNKSFYMMRINTTAKNTSTIPIEISFVAAGIMDNSGDGCQSDTRSQCGITFLNLQPGESKTRSLNVTIFSANGYEYLSSKEFCFDAIIDSSSKSMGGINHGSWLIDLKNSTNSHEPAGCLWVTKNLPL